MASPPACAAGGDAADADADAALLAPDGKAPEGHKVTRVSSKSQNV